MNLKRTSPPATTPITLAEAKAHCRVDVTDDDTLITSLIETATERLDGRNGWLDRALVTQTWELRLDDFPRGSKPICLPFAPVQSITSIQYWDTATPSVQTPWDAANWEFEPGDFDPFISLAESAFYPATKTRRDAVLITFIAGYGAASDVPEPLKHAIKLMVGEAYERREEAVVAASYTPTMAVANLISTYQRRKV